MKIDYRLAPAFIISLLILLYNIYDSNITGIVTMGCLTLLWLLLIIFKLLK